MRKKTQDEKNSKLKGKTKTQAQNSNFRHFLKPAFSENICCVWGWYQIHTINITISHFSAYFLCYLALLLLRLSGKTNFQWENHPP